MKGEGVNNDSTGPQTKTMRKAKMSFQSGQVKQVIRTYAVEVQTSDKHDLKPDVVEMKLRKAMGANCKFFESLTNIVHHALFHHPSPQFRSSSFMKPSIGILLTWCALQMTDKARHID